MLKMQQLALIIINSFDTYQTLPASMVYIY